MNKYLDYFFKRIKAYSSTLIKEGPYGIVQRLWRYIKKFLHKLETKKEPIPKDFLFISGCFLDNPHRFRCENQAEQLRKQGMIGDIIYFNALDIKLVDYYDIFVFYRLPISPLIKEFVEKAKRQNKLCVFDIDDLLFDEKYVKDRYELTKMTNDEREVYLDGVRRTNETIKLCDYGITTTEILAREMRKYLKDVHIARNSMSDVYIEYSGNAYKLKRSEKDNEVVLGYASGSPSHDRDFEMIEGVILKLLEKYANLKFMIVGYLELSSKFEKYRDRIIRQKFVKWKDLPSVLVKFDINLAPSEDTLFNNAKSEIKFLEAALVGVPTVASSTKPFKHAIRNGKTSFLAGNSSEWKKALSKLIESRSLREKMGKRAYKDVLQNYNTNNIGRGLLEFITSKKSTKVTYVLPSLFLSGGNIVCLEHLTRLQTRGYNTSIIYKDEKKELNWFDASDLPIISSRQVKKSKIKFENLVATMWSTVEEVMDLKSKNKFYLVQGKEHEFYTKGTKYYVKAKETYSKDIVYLTVSRWCKKWLKRDFGKDAIHIPNGIDLSVFKPRDSKELHSPVRILVEGNPEEKIKNIDEAFNILNRLELEKEVWFVSYGGQPKDWYKTDKSFNKVPHRKMAEIYADCDILLKTAYLESFNYPPLEMMATGGFCVIAENEGGMSEYIKDNYNCLVYKVGDEKSAVNCIDKLIENDSLRKRLTANGLKTARRRDWRRTIDILENVFR